MCNLYNLTTTRDAVMEFTRAFADKAGWNAPSLDVYPGTLAPIVRVGADGKREIATATWGMPTPPAYIKGNYDPGVTNIRNVNSPHWRRWLGPTSRCVVPFTSFAEPDPASKVEGGRVPNAWFARNADRPLMFFAGFWTPWKGVRKVRDGEREFELYGFLTTSPNEIVSPIHQKAMPAILTTPEEVDLWLTADWEAVRHLQRPLPGNMLIVVEPPAKPADELLLVDFRRELTRDWAVFPLRSDPCLNPPLLVDRRGHWSDRHGVTERYPTLASAGWTFDPGDCAAHGAVAEHDPQIPAIRRGGAPLPGAGAAEQA